MKFTIHPEAKIEIVYHADYYEDKQPGLGEEFIEEIYATIQRILEFPQAWQKISKTTRRCLTSRFPFGVIYSIEPDRIRILSVMLLNREPYYWKDRR